MNGIFPETAKKGRSLGWVLAVWAVLAGSVAHAGDYRENVDGGWHFKYFGAGNPAEQAEEVRYAPAQADYDEAAAPAVPAPAGGGHRAHAAVGRGFPRRAAAA